ncbi:uncharacterized protein LOC134230594 [Saccostrea cucullata]|uniref:uncharacterized protein LOC134230594 n=1 Tax=Saccostrea cuccullata TaxID=36930 RepID=UPI002ED1976A
METKDQRKVTFNPDVEQAYLLDGKWSFLRYLLTLNEEINLQIVCDTLEDRGVLTPSDKDDVLQQGTYKDRIDTCIQRVLKSCPSGYNQFCEVLKDCGYNHVVENLRTEREDADSISKYTLNSEDFYEKTAKDISMPWDGSSPLNTSFSEREEKLAIVGVKMSLSTLSKDTKASQREFNTIIQRQSELEKQLADVMKTLDSAKDALIREREEKAQLLQQLRFKDDEIADMQRKYRDLQNAMGKLKETNNRFHERVTKLQNLNEKSQQISQLKRTIEDQELQISNQEHVINKKLSMIEHLASGHQRLADGQIKLEDLLVKQNEEIMKLGSEKESAHQLLAQQQKQLNTQQASLAILQENLERLEMTVLTQQEQQNVLAILPPSDQNYRGKKQPPTTKPMLTRPFNTSGKVENSKNLYWKNPNGNKMK